MDRGWREPPPVNFGAPLRTLADSEARVRAAADFGAPLRTLADSEARVRAPSPFLIYGRSPGALADPFLMC